MPKRITSKNSIICFSSFSAPSLIVLLLSLLTSPEGDHNIRVTVSKMSALSRQDRPCYNGPDYGYQEYVKLAELVREKFGCMSPFIPERFRGGTQLCRNQTKVGSGSRSLKKLEILLSTKYECLY